MIVRAQSPVPQTLGLLSNSMTQHPGKRAVERCARREKRCSLALARHPASVYNTVDLDRGGCAVASALLLLR